LNNYNQHTTVNINPARKAMLLVVVIGLALVVSTSIVYWGDVLGLLIVLGLTGSGLLVYSFINTKFGFYCSIVAGFSVNILARKFGQELPWGTIVDLLIMVTFGGMIFRKVAQRRRIFESANHPITYAYLVYTIFLIVELFNPEMQSIAGWFFTFRKFLQFLMIYFISVELFTGVKQIGYFFSFWIFLAFISAAYGCYHEWFGMFDFEMSWIWSVPGRAGLYSLDNGNFRKFSLFSDPAAYGIGMAVSAVFTLVLMIGTRNTKSKLLLLAGFVFMLLAMAYSGTRTAFSILPAGIALYILMTITRRNTLIFACLSIAAFIVIVWGPIYGNPTINRIRSTFEFSDEASMQVRDRNREAIQPYILSHPIGGGLATSGMQGLEYNPNHILAGFPPDSGFLRSAVETGWLGLAIQCCLYFIILYSGAKGFYSSRNKIVRLYFLSATIGAFVFILAQYAQVSIGQIPSCFLFYPFLAIIVRLTRLRKPLSVSNTLEGQEKTLPGGIGNAQQQTIDV
jgi:putative inorganic carbon (HCO3(-)) transporter